MDERKSDTLEQRKKAQREFLELKRMQNGESAPPPKPSEESVAPRTFGEKLSNFWFHYKVHTLLVLFFAVIIAVCTHQCATRIEYDAKIILHTNKYYTSEEIGVLEEFFKPYFTDITGNGEVEVGIIDCSFNTEGTFDSSYVASLSTKLQASIANDETVQLFIVDEKCHDRLNNLSQNFSEFFIEYIPLPEAAYKAAEEGGFTLPEGCIIGRRIIRGTSIENKNEIAKYEQQAEEFMNKLK